MKIITASIIILISSSSILGQSFYGLTFMKKYTQKEITDHFWDKEVKVGDDRYEITIGNNKVTLVFGCQDISCKEKVLTIIVSYGPSEALANSMFENAKMYLGKPSGGFEEESIRQDVIYKGASVKEKNYYIYYFNKYNHGDLIVVDMKVRGEVKAGYLSPRQEFSITYYLNASYYILAEPYSNSTHMNSNKSWHITKQH